MEAWKPVVGYEDLYEVSDLGRVKSIRRSRVMKTGLFASGYVRVTLSDSMCVKTLRVHRLVLEAFRGTCPQGMQGCHNNGRRTDNTLTNLRWDTPRNNVADRKIHGTHLEGADVPVSKLREADIARIFALRKSGYSLSKIRAEIGGVTSTTLHRILRGKAWAHAGSKPIERGERRSDGANWQSSLVTTDVERIRDMRRCGVSCPQIAKWIGTTPANAWSIVSGKTWSHI